MHLQGKHILITGASGGIGQLLAERLARHGAHLHLVGRERVALERTKSLVSAAGGQATLHAMDLTDADQRNLLVERCLSLPEGLYGLVNGAGTNTFAFLADQTASGLQSQLHLNLMVPVLLTGALLPALQKFPDARILNIGSTFGSIGYPGYSAYCASKYGLRGFTESLRRELADTGIRVLYFAPRATQTSINPANVEAMNRELGNAMDPPDIVAAAAEKLFLDGAPNQLFLGWPEKLFARINQILPVLVDSALKKQLVVIKRFARQE